MKVEEERLDRPNREKIEAILREHIIAYEKAWLLKSTFGSKQGDKAVDQILALLQQKVELARKEGFDEGVKRTTIAMDSTIDGLLKEAKKEVANKIEADMPTITRYKALEYLRNLCCALKGGSL